MGYIRCVEWIVFFLYCKEKTVLFKHLNNIQANVYSKQAAWGSDAAQ